MNNIPEQKRVLVVEDNPGIIELIKIVLEDNEYEVLFCDNGESALNIVRAERPGIVLLDLWIPQLNGEQVTRMLKIKEETRDIPVIIISAQTNLPEITARIGADGYLTKPFDIDDLVRVVEKHTSGKN